MKAEQFETHAGIEGIETGTTEAMEVEAGGSRAKSKTPSERGSRAGSVVSEGQDEVDEWEAEANLAMSDYRVGAYSPQYIRVDDLPPGTVTFLEEEDLARRNFDQQKALKGSKVGFINNFKLNSLSILSNLNFDKFRLKMFSQQKRKLCTRSSLPRCPSPRRWLLSV